MTHPSLAAPVQLHRLEATRLAVALWGGLAVLDLTHLLGVPPLLQLMAIAALVAGCSHRVGTRVALSVAAIGWLLVNGFVVHDLGQLGLTGVGDLARAVLLGAVALLTSGRVR